MAEDDPTPTIPGASLYLFLESVPVPITLRWFVQCVVLAKSTTDGGVPARFLANLNAGTVDYEYVECDNYVLGIGNHAVNGAQNPASTLPLHQWLRTAPFLFTLIDTTDGENKGMSALQINQDVSDTITYAINELQVFEMPDIFCVKALDDWEGMLQSSANIRHHDLLRYGTREMELANTKAGGFTRQLERVDNASMHKQVRDFLTGGLYQWDVDKQLVTVQELLAAEVIRKVQHDMQAPVLPREVYPEYEYVRLTPEHMMVLTQEKRYTAAEYVFDTPGACTCDAQSADTNCKRLKAPEYKTLPMRCETSKVLECTSEVERLLNNRMQNKPPFLQQQELLYLVLLIIKNEIKNTISGGFMALHRLRAPAEVQAVSELFAHELPHAAQHVSLVQAKQFNDFVRSRNAISWKCPAKSVDWQLQTNTMHAALRQCKLALQEKLGWTLPASAGGFTKTLEIQPSALSMLAGFYPSFMFRDRAGEHKTFLDTLLDTRWERSDFAEFERAVCYEANGDISVMAPFWAELFDVATNVAGEDSASDPAIGCDMLRSGSDSTILTYNTLCSSSSASARPCAEHPEYEHHVLNTLPPVCAQKHGQPVVRGRLGALRRHLTPLCQQQPSMPNTCPLRHGALHGHTGQAVSDLDEQTAATHLESGFWKRNNTIFRGVLSVWDSATVPALALGKHDIGGHCLEFSISVEGFLYLHKARLTSNCKQAGGEVRTWLQNIEQDWAWEDSFARKFLVQQETDRVSWTCPLHWLQRYHDDNSQYQARSPSWTRNKARFAHITGEYAYAHPTVRNTHRLRGVSAARWISDTMGCVAVDERQCHSAQYLTHALNTLLAGEKDWRTVSYVPAAEQECARVLDWPSDCGIAGGGDAEGECFMRQ